MASFVNIAKFVGSNPEFTKELVVNSEARKLTIQIGSEWIDIYDREQVMWLAHILQLHINRQTDKR